MDSQNESSIALLRLKLKRHKFRFVLDENEGELDLIKVKGLGRQLLVAIVLPILSIVAISLWMLSISAKEYQGGLDNIPEKLLDFLIVVFLGFTIMGLVFWMLKAIPQTLYYFVGNRRKKSFRKGEVVVASRKKKEHFNLDQIACFASSITSVKKKNFGEVFLNDHRKRKIVLLVIQGDNIGEVKDDLEFIKAYLEKLVLM